MSESALSLHKAGSVRFAGKKRRFLRNEAPSLYSNAEFIIVAAVYWCSVCITLIGNRLPFFEPEDYLANFVLYCAALIAVLAPAFLFKLYRIRPDSPFSFWFQFARDWKLAERARLAAPAVAMLVIFMPAFSAMKAAIPAFSSYRFDPQFVALDQIVHGQDAWRLIDPLVGYPIVTFFLSASYQIWILLLYVGALLVAGWCERPDIRMQFLLTYALCWALLGSLAAVAFSSVGPCFYDDFYGSNRFQPLMDYLASVDRSLPIPALDIQQWLLDRSYSGSGGLGSGITAMPSMHLSIASLFAITGFKISRTAGLVATAYMIIILLGSVHLGYHYAIDGYFAIIATWLIWVLTGWMLRKRSASRERTLASNPIVLARQGRV